MRWMGWVWGISLVLQCGWAAAIRADLEFSTSIGWDSHICGAHWNPIFLTIKDDKPRPLQVELYAPRDSMQGQEITQQISVGPIEQTYPLLIPLVASQEAVRLRLRDLATGKIAGEAKLLDPEQTRFQSNNRVVDGVTISHGSIFVGVSGREPTLGDLGNDTTPGAVTLGYLPPSRLPSAAIGFDALDILVLNQPDLSSLDSTQKSAIIDWVKAGGKLLMWFGPEPIAANDPMLAALPCTIGERVNAMVSEAELRAAGLPQRFSKLTARVLTSKAGAKSEPVLASASPDSPLRVVYGRCGLGQIAVLSFDGSLLQFQGNRNAHRFWDPVLRLNGIPDDPAWKTLLTYDFQQTGNQASGAAMDLLGDIPGVGAFGFKYVTITLIALMLVVGPIDWFLLRRLGRQPWTWVTTTGWIGLVTCSAIYIGHLVRSGDLYYRTLRIIDQADGQVVAGSEYVAIYSPRTTEYRISPPEKSWWAPFSENAFSYSRQVGLNLLQCRETWHDTLPSAFTVPVWNLRFLEGRSIGKAPPLLTANLQRDDEHQNRLTGSIVSNIGQPLEKVWLNLRGRWTELPTMNLASLNLDMDHWSTASPLSIPHSSNGNAFDPTLPEGHLASPETVVAIAGELSARRAQRMLELFPAQQAGSKTEAEDLACIYALYNHPLPASRLEDDSPAKQKHWLVVRAVVPVTHAK